MVLGYVTDFIVIPNCVEIFYRLIFQIKIRNSSVYVSRRSSVVDVVFDELRCAF